MSPISKLHVKGLPPLAEPLAGRAIEERLREEEARRSAEHAAARSATPARLIASDAYRCARQVALRVLEVPKDVKYDATQLMTFRAGDWYHAIVQEAMVRGFGMRFEVDFDWRPGHDLYGRCDGAYDDGMGAVAVEIKSQAGFGFDLATGARSSASGPGPKLDHLVQAGMAAMSPQVRAGRVHVVYVNKDRGVVAEWVIGLDDPLPHIGAGELTCYGDAFTDSLTGEPIRPTTRALVEAEVARQESEVLAVVDGGLVPARMVPGHGLVEGEPPAAGSRGTPWNCRYCSWQPSCAAQPAGEFPIELTAERRLVTPVGAPQPDPAQEEMPF